MPCGEHTDKTYTDKPGDLLRYPQKEQKGDGTIPLLPSSSSPACVKENTAIQTTVVEENAGRYNTPSMNVSARQHRVDINLGRPNTRLSSRLQWFQPQRRACKPLRKLHELRNRIASIPRILNVQTKDVIFSSKSRTNELALPSIIRLFHERSGTIIAPANPGQTYTTAHERTL